jgi:hypothetical protein
MHKERTMQKKIIASYVGPRSFAARTRAALECLGYSVIQASTRGRFDDSSWRPVLRIADERHLQRLPKAESDPDTPIILLTGARPRRCDDARIAGRVQRPAELGELYRLLQLALERHPRSAPRVGTHLAARCVQSDRRWVGAVVSLSRTGCLFRSSELVERGMRMNLQFALPRAGLVSTRAEVVHRRGGNLGLAFSETSSGISHDIDGFVTQRLAAASGPQRSSAAQPTA